MDRLLLQSSLEGKHRDHHVLIGQSRSKDGSLYLWMALLVQMVALGQGRSREMVMELLFSLHTVLFFIAMML
jgi:hypothetical protein